MSFFTNITPQSLVAGIAESNPILARGVSAILADSGVVEGRVLPVSGDSRACAPELATCDVVIFDPSQTGDDLTAYVAHVRSARKDAAFVLYSDAFSHRDIQSAIALGRICCVCKSDEPEQLVLATLSASRGATYFSLSVADALDQPAARPEQDYPMLDDRLSPRESAVLLAFARGRGLKQISDELGLSERTINTYKSRAARKLGLSNRSEIVQYALANGLI
ncbi:helix-turn-helix transcriptional regulator [Tropicimonas aquimaris]|uniref:Response regulator transcription factor n=1 Tax=Tropicimonas aquimaris TaxID=914152 RepID=A0ABW3ILJ2_9RHOB